VIIAFANLLFAKSSSAGVIVLSVVLFGPMVVLYVYSKIEDLIRQKVEAGVRKGIESKIAETKREQASLIRQAELQRDKIVSEQKSLIRQAESRKLDLEKLKNSVDEYVASRRKAAARVYEQQREMLQQMIKVLRVRSPVWASRFIEDLEFQCLEGEYVRSQYSTVRDYVVSRRRYDREKRREAFLSRYLCAYYESLFPDLVDLSKSLVDNGGEESFEKDGWWLSVAEYNRLSDTERAQLTLDRYISGRKSNWAVGRDYELYCGSIYRNEGYDVEQFGVNRRLQDMGRDLICTRDTETLIVQCKFWGQNRTIYEKHIAQLFGSTVAYVIDKGLPIDSVINPSASIIRVFPVFVTSANLSKVALDFAEMLGVKIRYLPFDPKSRDFPRVKCNINGRNKIYHLPPDQKYDDTVIDLSKGERYAFSCKEAELCGFRRAMHWLGCDN
jgi:hypothetical protein